MFQKAKGRTVSEQIEDLFQNLDSKYSENIKVLRNRIIQSPEYFDNQYRNLQSYVNELLEKKVDNEEDVQEDIFKIQVEYRKQLKSIMEHYGVRVKDVGILPFHNRV